MIEAEQIREPLTDADRSWVERSSSLYFAGDGTYSGDECEYCHSVIGERQASLTDNRGYLYCSRYCVSRAYPEVGE
jgi:hypothetical protein